MRKLAIRTSSQVAFVLLLTGVAHPMTELSGTVTSEEEALPLEGITVGVTRLSEIAGLDADDPIPVEYTATTDSSGVYAFNLDETLPGMDQLHVFTFHQTVFNEIYNAVDARGMAPRRRDLDEPGCATVDLTSGSITWIDFEIASSKNTTRVLMSDGLTELGTDVWLPSRRPGMSWPVLLQRTFYGRGWPPQRYTEGDYAVVIQNTRGREDSDGVDDVFDDDGWLLNRDGYDTVEWVAAQPWCNGRVGSWGRSAHGATLYLTEGAAPPHLAAALVGYSSGNLYHDWVFPGGEFLKYGMESWLGQQGSLHKLDEWLAHGNYDGYWSDRDLSTRFDQVRVPTLHIGGWYDYFTQGTLDMFTGMHESGGAGARRNQKLVMGPWTHVNSGSMFQGELIYPIHSTFPEYPVYEMRWFDFWLKGEDTGIMDEPPARAYVIGPGLPEGATAPGNFWRTMDTWPPPGTSTAYFLQPDGTLSTTSPPPGGGETVYASKPTDPAPNVPLDEWGPADQRTVDDTRGDIVVWQTPPLTSAVEVSGPITFVLYASSDRLDTDWAVKLEDVYPDGRVMSVADLILRARHRNGHDQEALLTPGQIYRFDVALWDTSITFPPGHSIRVAVASANYPKFEVNPQTGEPFNEHTHTEVAINRVQHNATHLSHLLLSVVDPAALDGCRPTTEVTGLQVEKMGDGEIRLEWDPVIDGCHARYRVYAGIIGPQWPWIVRRPVAETSEAFIQTDDAGIYWQVVSEGTDGGNGPH